MLEVLSIDAKIGGGGRTIFWGPFNKDPTI